MYQLRSACRDVAAARRNASGCGTAIATEAPKRAGARAQAA